jgi:hypothetical protein
VAVCRSLQVADFKNLGWKLLSLVY